MMDSPGDPRVKRISSARKSVASAMRLPLIWQGTRRLLCPTSKGATR